MEDKKEEQNRERTGRSKCWYQINHNAGRVDLSIERSVVVKHHNLVGSNRADKERKENRRCCNR